ncbi:unnamed protein product [Adineta ricciae]|uniref:NAD(P)(+)--arginine ADP-ribosyltransferase n=1 Tax=Adineta ricciae TaxID=249248 RepID=A0A815J3D9_ADIRI|nr:unnamed protein product [Adineta ricciae]CAF1469931.1 unnamed protein product [Adineta ricciae]
MGSGTSTTSNITQPVPKPGPIGGNGGISSTITSGLGRGERFNFPEPAVKSFAAGRKYGQFQEQALADTQRSFPLCREREYKYLAKRAANGILVEGRHLNQELQAERMAAELRECVHKTERETHQCAVRLYSEETFLYKLLNATLRNEDLSKVTTLGSFYVLLWQYTVKHSINLPELTVYRGTTLLPGMIEGYQEALGHPITYYAFTSTTKDFRVAEQFGGNAIFIIRLIKSRYQAHTDIAFLSKFPDEQEVLLMPGYQFYVDQIAYDSVNKKHLIYMTGRKSIASWYLRFQPTPLVRFA